MQKCSRICLFSAFCLFVLCAMPFRAIAMDWPSGDAVLARNFGWNDSGEPVLGSVFRGEGKVQAVEAGELIFHNSGGVSGLPSPLGAWTAIDHGDGLISIYCRTDENSAKPPVIVEKKSPVADSGISGWTKNKGFYFVLYDRRERRWVNPSMIISPFPDTRAPQIISVDLRNSRGEQLSGPALRSLPQGAYTITVNAIDTMQAPNEPPLAPHRIICSINGNEAGSLNFETISARGGQLLINRGMQIPVRQVYAPFPAFEAGDALLSRGQANLEVIVQDIAGNSRSTIIRMQVE